MQGLSHLRIVNPTEFDSPGKSRRVSHGEADAQSPRKIIPVPSQIKSIASTPTAKKVENGRLSEEADEKLTLLLEAINDGNDTKVIELINSPGFERQILDARDDVEGYTPLMTAAAYEDDVAKAIRMTKVLVDSGANLKVADKRGNTCLHWASRLGSPDEILDLVSDGTSDIRQPNLDGNTALHLASRYGNIRIVKRFLKEFAPASPSPSALANHGEDVEMKDASEDEDMAKKTNSQESGKGKNSEEIENVGKDNEEADAEEEDTAAPKRNPVRGVRTKALKAEKKVIRRKPKQASKPYVPPEDQKQNSEVAPSLLLKRNLKGETPFDLAAEKYDPEDVKPKEVKAAIRQRRRDIQAAFYAVSSFFKTLVLHHEDCLGHVPVNEKDKDVWEAPERMRAVLASLDGVNRGGFLVSSAFEAATEQALHLAHSKEYIEFVYKLSEEVQSTGPVPFTPRVQESVQALDQSQLKNPDLCDTSFSKGSLQASLRATGAVLHAVDRVLGRLQRNAFCIVRPPGHHAGIDGLLDEASSCGFCIFNNVAIGALHALKKYPEEIRKVAIIDFDVHHGNGTEEIVAKYNRENGTRRSHIMFFSAHLFDGARPGSKYEFYPGSGENNNMYGNIVNVPMQPLWRRKGLNTRSSSRKTAADRFYLDHYGRTEFRRIVRERLIPTLRAYEPDMIMLSAGFDAGRRDVGNGRFLGRYCSGFNLQQQDFAWVTTQVSKVANLCCEGRIVSVLEGGYGRLATPNKTTGNSKLDRSSLARNCCAHLEGLIDPLASIEPDSSESEESETEYDDNGRPVSEEADESLNRGSRSRRKPARFDGETEKSGRSRKHKSRGMKADAHAGSKFGKSKKRGRAQRDSSDDDRSEPVKSSRRESKGKGRGRGTREKGSRRKSEKVKKDKLKKLKSKSRSKDVVEAKKERVQKTTKAKRRKTQQEEEARQRTQKRQDALEYLQEVKKKFADNPEVYRNFLGVMGDFKQGAVDVADVIEKVRVMFKGDRHLIEGFNTFLPPGYTLKFTAEDERVEQELKASADAKDASSIKPESGQDVKAEAASAAAVEPGTSSRPTKESPLKSEAVDTPKVEANVGSTIGSATAAPTAPVNVGVEVGSTSTQNQPAGPSSETTQPTHSATQHTLESPPKPPGLDNLSEPTASEDKDADENDTVQEVEI